MGKYQKLHDLYYNDKTGFVGIGKLLNKVHKLNRGANRAKHINLTDEQIRDWYNSQEVNQVYKPREIYDGIRPITSAYLGDIQVDLMDVSKFAGNNNGIKYLLNIINIVTRYVWCFPLHSKSPKEIAGHLKDVLDQINKKIQGEVECRGASGKPIQCGPDMRRINIGVDKGKEFMGAVNQVIADNKIPVTIYRAGPEHKNAMMLVERFHKTLWTRLKKYMFANDTTKYINVLPRLIAGYNSTVHSSTGRTPKEAWDHINKPHQITLSIDEMATINEKIKKANSLHVGDKVRKKMRRRMFNKASFAKNYSGEIYTVVKVLRGGSVNKYVVESDDDGREILKYSQLIKIPDGTHKENRDTMNKEIKKAESKKRFVRSQHKSNLDVNKDGEIQIPKRYRRATWERGTRSSTRATRGVASKYLTDNYIR